MTSYQTARMEAVTVKPCLTCQSELLTCDKFCRRCGRRQAHSYDTAINFGYSDDIETKPLVRGTGNSLLGSSHSASLTVSLLGTSTENSLFGSSPLVRMITEGLSAKTAKRRPGRALHGLVRSLITIPIWILIVLLSPLEAYTVSKAVANWWTASRGDNEHDLGEKRQKDVKNYRNGR